MAKPKAKQPSTTVTSSTTAGDEGDDSGEPLSLELLMLLMRLGVLKREPPPLMDAGDVVKGYEFKEKLGKGGFGEVWKVEKEGKEYAIKVMKTDDSTVGTEILFVDAHLKSPFLVQYIEVFKVSSANLVFFVMELCEQGDLSRLLKLVNPEKCIGIQTPRLLKIFTQLCLGVNELHTNNIIHRDLKIDNIFVDDNDNIKIGDFGCSRVLDSKDELRKTVVGTLPYMGPEFFNKAGYGKGADLWAIGVVMYELCTGSLPFDGKTRDEIQQKIMTSTFKPIPKFTVPDDIIKAVNLLLNKDPTKRPDTLSLLRIPVIRESAKDNGLLKYFPPEALSKPPFGPGSSTFSSVPHPTGPSTPRRAGPGSPNPVSPRPRGGGGGVVPPDPDSVPHRFVPVPGLRFSRAPNGDHCEFTVNDFRTCFLERPFTKGIWRWSIQIQYSTEQNSVFRLGSSPADGVSICTSSYLGWDNGSKSSSFFFSRQSNGSLGSRLCGVKDSKDIPGEETSVPDNALVSMEINVSARTLTFFVNNTPVPRGIMNISVPVHAGVSGMNKPSFTSVSLKQLLKPTPARVKFYSV